MEKIVALFQNAGVRAVFSGHEHNFQHNRADGIDYFVTGAAGKLRSGTPNNFEKAQSVSWCAANHFLLVTINGNQMRVRPIGSGDKLSEIRRLDRRQREVTGPIVVDRV
jgi:hypothetical protein